MAVDGSRPLVYGSVCSGIEAATVAWHPLGMRPAWFCEIEPFPSAVLAHHYPETPNYGDFTQLLSPDHERAAVDVLVGGTPCQAFSVAGLRGGLADPRGNLALAFVALVGVLRPRWVVWENVPGVLSVDGGRAFGSFLGGLAELGYGWAYRVLDAQYFGLAQRRQRVFVVASPGDWRRSAAVLFEPEGVRRDSPPRRETGAGVAGAVGTGASCGGGWRVGADEVAAGHVVPAGVGDVAAFAEGPSRGEYRPGVGTIRATGGACGDGSETLLAYGGNHPGPLDVATTCNAKGGSGRMDYESETFVAHTLRAEGHDASEDGTGRGVPLVPVPFDTTQITSRLNRSNPKPGDPCHPLAAGAHVPAVAFSVQEDKQNGVTVRDIAGSVRATAPGSQQGGSLGLTSSGVRRLMPHELERLQGFPDHYTCIPYRGKPADDCPDGPRAKALGNSMAVPVMRWIGERIVKVDAL